VEALEDRALLSIVPSLPHGGVAVGRALVKSQVVSRGVHLTGPASGTWSAPPALPDLGKVQTLSGSANFQGLGAFELSGTLSTPGRITPGGRTRGTIVLTNASGSLTVQLVGTSPQPGFTGPARNLRYTIVSGTGAYAGDTGGSGPVTLLETVLQQTVVRRGGTEGGSFFFTFA
jgi:hypothetical protein